jgi:chromosome segregation ATPase
LSCVSQVEKEKDSLRLELSNAKSNINDAEAALASQKAQLEKLNHVVAEADAGAHEAITYFWAALLSCAPAAPAWLRVL